MSSMPQLRDDPVSSRFSTDLSNGQGLHACGVHHGNVKVGKSGRLPFGEGAGCLICNLQSSDCSDHLEQVAASV